MDQKVNKSFLEKYEFVIPLALFIVFLALTLPGISWGAPSTWHPDEIVIRVIKALHGEWRFSEINFDYPDLPQYVMFWLGKVVLRLGYTDKEVLIASRVLSAALAGLTIVLVYLITHRAGGSYRVAGLSGLFLLCVSEMAHNGRFAHNDMFLTFFATLAVLFLVNYGKTGHAGWLYAAFISVGFAASSKYNGISLVLAPVLLYLLQTRQNIFKRPFEVLKTLFIGGALTILGFGAGTPKALLEPTYYFNHMIPALLHTGNYNRQPGSIRGILGQYAVLADGLGTVLFLLFGIGLVWACYQVIKRYFLPKIGDPNTETLLIVLLAIIALDVPVMLSYNYPIRFFSAMMPMLAILGAFMIEYFHARAIQYGNTYPKLVGAVVVFVVLISLARITSVMLLFINDARFPAGAYIQALPAKASLEHTLYPPTIPFQYFRRSYDYPIYFVKVPGDPIPTSNRYVFNMGEPGINQRKTRYFVVDSFTADKFNNPYTCAQMQAECDFFKQLATGRSKYYKLIAEFSYSPPAFLPQLDVTFVNPTIRIYERAND